jgi:hypothetical protein
VPVASKTSPVQEESILTASIAREQSSVLKISTLADPFVDTGNIYVDGIYDGKVVIDTPRGATVDRLIDFDDEYDE